MQAGSAVIPPFEKGLSPEEIDQRARECFRAGNRCDYRLLQYLHKIEADGGYDLLGYSSMEQYCRMNFGGARGPYGTAAAWPRPS